VPVIDTTLGWRDTLGRWRVRWCIGRNRYTVPPGLYAIGTPDAAAPVLVTANYKVSYDLVRSALAGRSVWLLVLETYGINVWCAAGKGTFGTGELVRRVEATGLTKVVEHRRLILPLLGAPGVKVREVASRCGFLPRFSVARAHDLPVYLDGTVTPAMRSPTFTLGERLALTPVELVLGVGKGWPVWLVLFLAGAFAHGTFEPLPGLKAAGLYLTALGAGSFVVPLLLPWLPGLSFAGKGAVTGLAAGMLFVGAAGSLPYPWQAVGTLLVVAAASSFFALNFTGSTPFTSRSGVKREMARALPLQAAGTLLGAVLWVVGVVAGT
jgi:acetyl-CoA decarbonylase/synthase complex subunit gamma